MLDPQYAARGGMIDAASPSGSPRWAARPDGTPGALVSSARGTTTASAGRPVSHLGALDLVYAGVIADAPRRPSTRRRSSTR